MKKKLLVTAGCCSLLLSACATKPVVLPPEPPPDHSAYVALAEAAGSVSNTITQLGETEQAAYPPKSISTPPSPASYGMDMPTTIEWNGPIKPLVQQIANATNYKLKVLGNAPSIPVIVSVSAKNKPIGDILRDAGYQCGKKAQIVVFPTTKHIELRYTKL
jgi:defect in organelle trafficking protein DotD